MLLLPQNVVSIIKTHSCDLSPLNFSVLIQFSLKCIPITHRGVNKICSAWEKPFRNACYEKFINLSLSFCLEEVLINEALKLTSVLGDLVGQWLWLPAPNAGILGSISGQETSYHLPQYSRSFPGGAVVKNLPANAGDAGSIPGREETLEEETATSSSILAGKFHGQRSPVGYSPWDHRVGYNWITKHRHAATKIQCSQLIN